MQSDYVYPHVSDRSSAEDWADKGALDIWQRAKVRTQQILSTHYPTRIDRALDDKIRQHFNILMPREAMQPGNGR